MSRADLAPEWGFYGERGAALGVRLKHVQKLETSNMAEYQ